MCVSGRLHIPYRPLPSPKGREGWSLGDRDCVIISSSRLFDVLGKLCACRVYFLLLASLFGRVGF